MTPEAWGPGEEERDALLTLAYGKHEGTTREAERRMVARAARMAAAHYDAPRILSLVKAYERSWHSPPDHEAEYAARLALEREARAVLGTLG